MKKFLRSIASLALLLSSIPSFADNCNTSCNTNCNTNFNCNTNCNTNFNTCNTNFNNNCFTNCSNNNSCNFSNNDNCSRDRSRSCSEDNCCTGFGSSFNGRTGLHYRSQGANTARELVGWQWDIYRPFMCNNFGVAYLAYEYSSTFKSRCLAEKLFGADCWRFEGSLVNNRTPGSLVADNFGLSRNFQGTICFRPRIQNHIVDFGLFLGLDCWCPGLYFRWHSPIAYQKTCLESRCNDCCEVQQTTTCPTFDPCYDSSTAAAGSGVTNGFPSSTTNSFSSAVVNSNAACTIEQALSGNFLWGDVKKPWSAGRFDFGSHCRWGLADIDLILGYNFCRSQCGHFGVYAQAVLPTGTRRNDRFVFSPVIGNGGHFELGAGLSGHAVLWSCENSTLGVFFEGNVTHMFESRQCRLFDFCQNGYLSRYLLLKQFDSNGTTATYNGNLVSATNVNNRRVRVSLDVKGDASVKLAWRWCGWGVDLGYNIYGHSHEKVRTVCRQDCLDPHKYGIKGTTGVCCFNYPVFIVRSATIPGNPLVPRIFPAGTNVALDSRDISVPANCPSGTVLPNSVNFVAMPDNCTQPKTTMFSVAPFVSPKYLATVTDADDKSVPCTVCLASNSNVPSGTVNSLGTVRGTDLALFNDPNSGFVVSSDSNNPCTTTLIDPSDNGLNFRSAEAPGLLTHKVFAHLDYVWQDCCGYNPHLGVGGEAEFEQRRRGDNFCSRGSFNQWGVWVKGSMNF